MRYLPMLLLLGCAPLLPGEPACGTPENVHAVGGASCTGEYTVACDCDDRWTLHCVDGRWERAYLGCGGLRVAPP
jgi:hypothetical protein